LAEGLLDQPIAIDEGLGEGRLLGGESQQICADTHLAVAAITSADADHRQVEFVAQAAGEGRRDMLDHQGETAHALELPGLQQQPLLGHGIGGLTAIAQLPHRLRCQAQMAHHRDAAAYEAVHHLQGFRFGPLELDPLALGFLEETPGGSHSSISPALIAQKGQVADHRCVLQAALDGGGVMQHRLEGDRQRRGMAQRHHRQRITHQDQIHTSGFRPVGAEGVPGRQHRDGLPFLLPPLQKL
tara:strand:+ start:6695 stop:7420 length:726 start_codon:yes stop_codon:yes gene_type:complete